MLNFEACGGIDCEATSDDGVPACRILDRNQSRTIVTVP